MANVLYDNFWLSSRIEDMYNSHLDLQQFCTVDNSLTGNPGMIRKINVYNATDGTEKLEMTKGNTKTIETTMTTKDYTILMAQNRFSYYDEEQMTDPNVVPVGTQKQAVDLFNTVNADIFAEFNKATLTASNTSPDFGLFADGVALLNVENTDNDPQVIGPQVFGFVAPKDMAKIRKTLKDELKYVEAFARTGYVGTVAGVNLYVKKDAVENTIVIATREAVTLFNKRGVEVEQERDANVRQNTIYARKYYLAALTDTTKAVKLTIGSSSAG